MAKLSKLRQLSVDQSRTLSSTATVVSTASRSGSLIHLLEADILGVLMKALTAHVEAVLADQTVTVAAGSA